MTKRKTTIDPPHLDKATAPPHEKDQLRRRLLKMILKNEAERRSKELGSRRSTFIGQGRLIDSAASLTVFDPDDRIGTELAAAQSTERREGPTSQRPA